jgi:hypothetical protein
MTMEQLFVNCEQRTRPKKLLYCFHDFKQNKYESHLKITMYQLAIVIFTWAGVAPIVLDNLNVVFHYSKSIFSSLYMSLFSIRFFRCTL